MKDDDIARQMVLRYQQDPTALNDPGSVRAKRVLEIANMIVEQKRLPKTIGEWLSVVLHYGGEPLVQQMRLNAKRGSQASYMQAKQWLDIIDRVRA